VIDTGLVRPRSTYPRVVRTVGGHAGAVAAAVLVVLAAGCSAGGDDAPPAASTSAAPEDATTALRERCLSAIPDHAELEATTLAGGDVEAARVGPATNATVAVLLPQIGGMCGWGRWATAAAEEAGLTSLLVNPCGYGESTCTAEEDADPLHEVAPALELARAELGARRVVLLGTSMGGSLTVIAAANGADIDAWADISGPPAWEGVELATLAADLPGHGLVVMAPSDGAAIFDASRALARAAGVRFVAGRSGHGWDLLVDPVSGSVTRIGRLLMEHAAGPFGA
jgi:pimeloyl-ACP methyl ester carboxylesterase